jgi:CDGSH-type Zn-finger protein/uncharacterized Fe-S cluster protein YjdI
MQEKIIRYQGEDVTISYDVRRCIHAAKCVRGLPDVFDPDRKPWIEPDQASAAEVADVVSRCPTGALHVTRSDGAAAEVADEVNTITVDAAGPLFLRGNLQLRNEKLEVMLADKRIALCRCGASKNKPLCDGSHREAGFSDPGVLGESSLGEVDDAGPLTITPSVNGPLLLEGPFEIRGMDQTVRKEGRKGALCRCGSSQNKPFCDGTHRSIGFKGE